MRLGYFTNIYPRATDTFIRREVLGLRKRGFDVDTFSVRRAGDEHDVDAEVISEKANTHYILPVNIFVLLYQNLRFLFSSPACYLGAIVLSLKTARPGLKGAMLQLFYFQEAVLLANKLKTREVTHLHNHLGDNSGTVTMLAAKLIGITYSISIHGPHIFFDALHWALDKKLANSVFVSCIGYYCKSQMMLYTEKKDWHKLQIIRCGIEPSDFPFKESTGQIKNLLYVGRLSAEKGLPILFESLQELQGQQYEFTLNVLGDGEDRKYLEKLSEEMGLADHVHFRGFANKEEISNWQASSDIFVLPSFAEGIPVALMEAMASGTPVIATYVGGIVELVEDQLTGQVVFPSDSRGLSKAIARYIDDKNFYNAVAKNAREKVCRDFYIEEQVDKLAGLFSSALTDIARDSSEKTASAPVSK